MHRLLLEYLTNICDVYLVSRFRDVRLKYPEQNDFRIFIPDLHLIDNERDKEYKYTTNCQALLLDMLTELVNFKEATNHPVTVYQLGDFLDLWREISVSISPKKATQRLVEGTQKIQEAKQAIVSKLSGLNTQFVFGNHDFDLHYIPDFVGSELRYYFPFEETSGFTFHGDVFSLFEKNMPVFLKKFGVNVFGPGARPGTSELGKFRREIVKLGKEQAKQSNQFRDYIQQPDTTELAQIIRLEPDTFDDNEFMKEDSFNINTSVTYLEEARKFAAAINKEQNWDLRFGVIGHTHRARIAVYEPSLDMNNAEPFFTLIDCGGWMGYCKGVIGDIIKTMPCAQIGVLYNNEARIYQLCRET